MVVFPHTMGSTCRLAAIHSIPRDDDLPRIHPQYFYSSIIPIDELLSTPRNKSRPERASTKKKLQAFGQGDNNALEKAWASLASNDYMREHKASGTTEPRQRDIDTRISTRRYRIVQRLAQKHLGIHGASVDTPDESRGGELSSKASASYDCCIGLRSDVKMMLQENFCILTRQAQQDLAVDVMSKDVIEALSHLGMQERNAPKTTISRGQENFDHSSRSRDGSREGSLQGHFAASAIDIKTYGAKASRLPAAANGQSTMTNALPDPAHESTEEVEISGNPSLRVGDLQATPLLPASNLPDNDDSHRRKDRNLDAASSAQNRLRLKKRPALVLPNTDDHANAVEVVVGPSRLHTVSLPRLLMKPIYWSPVNDMAVIMRATWFYRDTMMPVIPLVANLLEAGYQELRPWTQTWRDELRCATEIGPAGEEKIAHQLWPQDSELHIDCHSELKPRISADPFCSARCFRGEAAAQGSLDCATDSSSSALGINRPYANYQVIYKNTRQAFLLKPTLKPSAYHGRRPVFDITGGATVGLPVVRGFDRDKWEHINGLNQDSAVAERPDVDTTEPLPQPGHLESHICKACEEETNQGQVTDLVLVAHGIGQKIAERVESYHFTHAINSFRRAVNQEMGNAHVRSVLRENHNGVMILPLNWRMGISFEDGGPTQDEVSEGSRQNTFGLKDIEPHTIPAVRSMISDVMFDIPFYMSHHKNKMISALVSEANRVYRLWCRNNTGFWERGRVHLIAHSLGSVMAVDILSRQPTELPKIDLNHGEPETNFFEFDTTNLFLLGSPAGFFLLLERGTLAPRRGRHKPGCDSRDIADSRIVREVGSFGCLAVDNVYNILAKEDPIAYLLNGAVDPGYAAAIRTAYIPSTSASLMKSVGDIARYFVPGSPADRLNLDQKRPDTARLPSQVELEVHDFSREEIAEKKAFLLNDNGQIDWFLRSGNGPLEIQYLNMLSAHTSYWANQDFIRMLCMEIGRQPGRTHSNPAMRAARVARQFSTR